MSSLWSRPIVGCLMNNLSPYSFELPMFFRKQLFATFSLHNPWFGSEILSHFVLYVTYIIIYMYTVFHKKNNPFVISSYFCIRKVELPENYQKYTQWNFLPKHCITVQCALTILCQCHNNDLAVKCHMNGYEPTKHSSLIKDTALTRNNASHT